MSNTRRDFYKNSYTRKLKELNAVESQLAGTLSEVDKLRLNRQAEILLGEIENLEKKAFRVGH